MPPPPPPAPEKEPPAGGGPRPSSSRSTEVREAVPTIPSRKPEAGLIIKPEWLVKILRGSKTIELRGSYHKMHVGETIALCSSGDGRACWGQAKLHRVEGPLEDDRFKELQDQHCVHAPSCEAVQHKMSWKHVYAWHLSEVEVYETPLPYKNEHSVIWLDVRKAVADFAAA